MTKNYYLVRHGASTADSGEMELHGVNAPATVEDIPLSDMGRDEALRAAGFFRRLGIIDAVFSSPLIRTFDTAKIIAQPLGLEVQTLPEVKEVDLSGVLNFFKRGSGKMPVKFSPRDLPFELYRSIMLASGSFFFTVWRVGNLPENEQPEQVRKRLEAAFRILDATPFRNILIVTHGFFLTYIASWFVQNDPAALLSLRGRVWVPNCSVTKIVSTDGKLRLAYFAQDNYDRIS